MSMLKLYTIRDVRTSAHNRPIALQNRAVLERSLLDALQDPSSNLSQHPEDYQLFCVGEFDQDTGDIIACPPEFLFNLQDLIKESE